MLRIVVRDLARTPPLAGFCAGFERGRWRADALADFLLDNLPDFCLSYRELQLVNSSTMVPLIRKAAQRVYDTDKFKRRGEFGELLLHVILKHFIGTLPAISKIYYKDSANDTVKGFDAVHVVPLAHGSGGLELWLGEVKFYKNIVDAIDAVVPELWDHTSTEFLKSEFYAIKNKIDDDWPHAEQLKGLLHEHTSLDQVFDAVCVPVLLTYDSDVTAGHTNYDATYVTALVEEFRGIHRRFAGETLPEIRIQLFLVPLATKDALVERLHEKLKAWQQI